MCFASTLWKQEIKNCSSDRQRLRYYWLGCTLYQLCGCKESRTVQEKDSACGFTGSVVLCINLVDGKKFRTFHQKDTACGIAGSVVFCIIFVDAKKENLKQLVAGKKRVA